MRPNSLIAGAAAFVIAVLAAGSAAAMTFQRVTSPGPCESRPCVLAQGEIARDTASEFKRFAEANRLGSGAVVILDSHGGNVLASLSLGRIIRRLGLSTTVQAYDRNAGRLQAGGRCASACVYAFLGGLERSVGPRAQLGVHQVAGPAGRPWELSASDGQWVMSLVAVHLSRMGVELELLALALRTPPQDMRWLTAEELVRYALVTGPAGAVG